MRKLAVLIVLLVSAPAAAQPSPAAPKTFEVAIASLGTVYEDAPLTVRGRAYEVSGLADLSPLRSDAIEICLRARGQECGDWSSLPTDAAGFFQHTLTASVPSVLVLRRPGGEHEVEQAITPVARLDVDARTDRRFYQDGEPIHAWALVRDQLTHAPLPNQEVVFELSDATRVIRATARTGASGAAYHLFPGVARAAGYASVLAQVTSPAGLARGSSVDVTFGERTIEPLFVQVDVPEESVLPGRPFDIVVRARSQDGEPIAGAAVEAQVADNESASAQTDAEGLAQIRLTAPALGTQWPEVNATVTHPAHGTAHGTKTLRIGAPNTFSVVLRPRHGWLMAGQSSPVFISVTGSDGDPAPDQSVRVRGPRGFDRTMRTNDDGLAVFEATFRMEDAAPVQRCGVGVPFDVQVGDDALAVTRTCAGVRSAPVRPTVNVRAAAPGEPVEVALDRVGRGLVVVDLSVSERGTGGHVVQTIVTNDSRVVFQAPTELGIAQVSAYRIEDGFSRSLGDTFVVRPTPAWVHVETDERVSATGQAEVRVSGGGAGWFALNVRDLAQHGGERGFRASFLESRIRQVLLKPDTDAAQLLLGAALAQFAWSLAPSISANEVVDAFGQALGPTTREGDHPRDPYVLAAEFRRRGVAAAYQRAEERLTNDPSGTTVGNGRARRFRDDLLSDLEGFSGNSIAIAALSANDPSFTFQAVASRIGRRRLLAALAAAIALDHAGEIPMERLLSEILRTGTLTTEDTMDPWGGRLGWRARPSGSIAFFSRSNQTLAFPGPDGRLGTSDDILDPFARIVAAGTPFAVASGEDEYMREVSLLSVGPQTLAAIIEALERQTRAMEDSLNGDVAVGGELGSDDGGGGVTRFGMGGFGGTGSGYGSGRGGHAGRSARAPRIRSGHASVTPGPGGSLLGALRERMPATLYFRPDIATDADGNATVQVPLVGAPTSYLVEVIHWRPDGFISSDETRFQTERPVTVRASTPGFATVGDRLEIPVRVSNQSGQAQQLALAIEPEGVQATRAQARATLADGASDMAVLAVTLSAPGEGALITEARGQSEGDRLRMALSVRPRGLRRRAEVDVVARDLVSVAFPGCAGSATTLLVDSGASVFAVADEAWIAWSHALAGRTPRASHVRRALQDVRDDTERQGLALALTWRSPDLDDDDVRSIIEAREEIRSFRDVLWLLGIAPIIRDLDARPSLRAFMTRYLQAQAEALAEWAATSTDDPILHASTAATILMIDPERNRLRAEELMRRAERWRFERGDAAWVEDPLHRYGSRLASALYALASIQMGDFPGAMDLLRTLAAGSPGEPHDLFEDLALAFGRAAADRIGPIARQVTVHSAGEATPLILDRGTGSIQLNRREGETLQIRARGLLRVRATTTCTGAWETARVPTPLELSLEAKGPAPQVDSRSEYELTVRNRRPGVLRDVVVRLSLPAGSSLDPAMMTLLRERFGANVEDGDLVFRIDSVFPGRGVRIGFTLRFGVGGELDGLGAIGVAGDRADAYAVIAPQRIRVQGGSR